MVVIQKKIVEIMKKHSISEAPEEACGVLAGINDVVTDIFECKNVDSNPNSAYTIDPKELIGIMEKVEKSSRGLEILGFYHSHPFSGLRPSTVDVARASWEGVIYAIYSIPEDDLGFWRWRGKSSGFIEEEVVIL